MELTRPTFLPGLNEQVKFLTIKSDLKNKRCLVLGSSSESVAQQLAEASGVPADLIVEDYDSLINSRLGLENFPNVNIRLMDFEATDFNKAEFDLVYAQGTISDERRKGILKELKRISKPDAIFCIGEMLFKTDNPPVFIQDVFYSSGIEGLYLDTYQEYYKSKNFEIVETKDLSYTLNRFYKSMSNKLDESLKHLSEQEKSYHKKLIKKISHESNVYLDQGGEKYMCFMAMILKRS